MEIWRLHRAEIEAHWRELGTDLYEGRLEYEHDYLKTYWQSARASG